MKSVLGEDSPPSDFSEKTSDFRRDQWKPNSFKRKGDGERSLAKKKKKRGNEKEPETDKDQSLESVREQKGKGRNYRK